MKKTLIVLMALAGVAMATETEVTPLTLTTTFNTDKSIASSLDSFELTDVILTNTATGDVVNNHGSGTYMGSYLRPSLNVDADPGASWTMTFTIANNGSADFTIDSITLNAFAFNGGGASQPNDRNFLFTVTADETTLATQSNLTIAAAQTATTPLTLTLDTPIVIAAKDDLEFSIVVERGAAGTNGRGSFVGLSSVAFNGSTPLIPEPTTATLSLLALAGLATRRRRK